MLPQVQAGVDTVMWPHGPKYPWIATGASCCYLERNEDRKFRETSYKNNKLTVKFSVGATYKVSFKNLPISRSESKDLEASLSGTCVYDGKMSRFETQETLSRGRSRFAC